MYVLYSFGQILEITLRVKYGVETGSFYFLLLYIGGALAGAVPSFIKHRDNHFYSALGASGAISALALAVVLIHPTMMLSFFFIIPMPGWIFAIVFFALEAYLEKNGKSNIGHDAHIWGALFGITLMILIDPLLMKSCIEEIIQHPFGP
jgi:membrane associated rhomboid family serine protease